MTWEYIAGFFDGEGSITRNGHGYRVTIPQTHEPVLVAIQRFLGYGSVMKVKNRQARWKQSWTFFISRQIDVLHFLRHVQGYSLVKRKLIDRALPAVVLMTQRQGKKTRRVLRYKRRAIELRHQGLSYRAIGQALGLDFGYVRRVILASQK